jgi:hypothetical protein
MEVTEKEVKEFMKGKFRVITQTFCVLVLTLSLGLATAVSVTAAEFPSILPTTAEYDLDDPAEVMTAITWGIGSNVVAVSDDEGNLVPGLGRDYIVLVKHLIILNTYLEDKLTDIGDSVELIVKFDTGAATLTITAIGTQPSISPATAQYDLDNPADVKTTITWGIATSVASIVDDEGHTLTSSQRSVSGTEVTIRSTYLATKLTDIGDGVGLTINFNRGNPAALNITAIGTQPSISPTTAQYNIDSKADVSTTITWGTASSVASIVDGDGHTLTGTQYTVTPITAGVSASLTIRSTQYLAGQLTDIGDKVALTVKFNLGNNATFEITATGVNAVVSPQTRDYDLDNPADARTTITWNTATGVTSIVDNYGHTLAGSEYTLTPITPGVSANLTILNSYLEGKLTDIGDKVVLTIKFDLGADATFTITAIGIQPRISPQTKEYDLDNPTNAVTTITWGTATAIVSIVDNDHYTLIKDADYTVATSGGTATLTILAEPYLEGKHMDIGDSIVLTIDFNLGADATFTITSIGIQPSVSPVAVDYDVIDRNDVSATITWGSAASVVSIVDDSGYLLAGGTQYAVTPITPGMSANLTVLSSTYLASKLRMFGEKLVLTIGFDVGRDATLTISVPPICFIATAAYGTPMAQQIQILREFRDEYLLTNPLGQALVDLYYGVSPPVAEFITEHPSLRPLVRAGLLPAVAMSAIAVNTTPVEKIVVVVGLLVLVAVAVAVWATRRRGRGTVYPRVK